MNLNQPQVTFSEMTLALGRVPNATKYSIRLVSGANTITTEFPEPRNAPPSTHHLFLPHLKWDNRQVQIAAGTITVSVIAKSVRPDLDDSPESTVTTNFTVEQAQDFMNEMRRKINEEKEVKNAEERRKKSDIMLKVALAAAVVITIMSLVNSMFGGRKSRSATLQRPDASALDEAIKKPDHATTFIQPLTNTAPARQRAEVTPRKSDRSVTHRVDAQNLRSLMKDLYAQDGSQQIFNAGTITIEGGGRRSEIIDGSSGDQHRDRSQLVSPNRVWEERLEPGEAIELIIPRGVAFQADVQRGHGSFEAYYWDENIRDYKLYTVHSDSTKHREIKKWMLAAGGREVVVLKLSTF